MAKRNKLNRMRSWKMERASVRRKRVERARSNKFSKSDVGRPPKKHARKKVWVGGHERKGGTKVRGHYRKNAQYNR